MIFIEELSCLLAVASSLESLARLMLTLVSAWAIRLNSYGTNVSAFGIDVCFMRCVLTTVC